MCMLCFKIKSMKFFCIALALGLAVSQVQAFAQVRFAAPACGEGMVPSIHNGICIEPNYIEGCLAYENETECASCHPSYKLS